MNRRKALQSLAAIAAGTYGGTENYAGAEGAETADRPRDVRITRITGFRLVTQRPKLVGRNSHLDVHGRTGGDFLCRIETSAGIDGLGAVANDRKAAYAIDGNPRTVWHSQFAGTLAEHPHELVIDLGAVYDIRGFRYLTRQDIGWNGAFAKTVFFVGDSPDSFAEPVVTRIFKKVRTAQAADCKLPVRGRYVRVRVLSEVNGKPWGSAAEIGVVGSK